MVDGMLCFGMPGGLEWIVILFIFLLCIAAPILGIVLIIRSLVRNKRENQRLRLEVGKLADELERMRIKGESNEDS
jgi:uncharacterized membrane protein